jgi:hypothetical protein
MKNSLVLTAHLKFRGPPLVAFGVGPTSPPLLLAGSDVAIVGVADEHIQCFPMIFHSDIVAFRVDEMVEEIIDHRVDSVGST